MSGCGSSVVAAIALACCRREDLHIECEACQCDAPRATHGAATVAVLSSDSQAMQCAVCLF